MPEVHGFDISGWQTDIRWDQIQAREFMAVRVLDGNYMDERFAEYWAQAAALNPRWLFAYGLLSDNDAQRQVDNFVAAINDSGVDWRPGMGVAIDIESTNTHPTATRGTSEWIADRLITRFDRPGPLTYSYYSGYVRDMAAENHWPLWLGWPEVLNGRLPNGTTVTVWQWGTAGAGEQPGFPNNSVDVNYVYGTDWLDVITGRQGLPTKDGFTMADLDTIQAMFNRGIDDLAALEARLDAADADRDRAITAHIDELKALVQQIASHTSVVSGAFDGHQFAEQFLHVLKAGVEATR